jgi:hypothetical protein
MHKRAVALTRREAVRRYSMRTDAAQIDHERTGIAVAPGGADGLPRPIRDLAPLHTASMASGGEHHSPSVD